ncbi:type I-B CRISPR-associated endonuclease Cas1 [bacterium]|nr:type I-B CRISPR-associated endonuclease Cas1 [bacterium]
MKRSYYLFNPGRLSRKDNTLKFVAVDEQGKEQPAKYLPVETVSNLYCFGSLDTNSALYNFLGKHHISVHFFDYYEHYTGSFMPKDYLLAGKVITQQVRHYDFPQKRIAIARSFVDGASFNIQKNLKYYNSRNQDLEGVIAEIENWRSQIDSTENIETLMGVEGNIRKLYYLAFDVVINDFKMQGRTKQPPDNEVNALISFGNMVCYTLCLDQIYHTQLNPTISYLHQPGERRYSLALDLAEIFKPLLVDRVIFKVLNKKMINKSHFEAKMNGVYLKDTGRKVFLKAFDERLSETIMHRSLGRNVSYKHLVKLEAYKLVKHLLDIEPYKPFKMWW